MDVRWEADTLRLRMRSSGQGEEREEGCAEQMD